ncbi:11-beta-hydroxysteroid dehydrogenase [Bertholletia excelsa]
MDRNYLFHMSLTLFFMPQVFVFFLCFILPPFFIFKWIRVVIRCVAQEDLRGKVVLITGASSGRGEQLACEYAKRGACLVIVARREKELEKVAERARGLGSPQVLPIRADVSNADECKRFVDGAIKHFGKLNHLVNNAGIINIGLMEQVPDVKKLLPIMDENFWGCLYPTYFAIRHLKETKGKIIVVSSVGAMMNTPRLSLYAASKAALISFYDTLRAECPEIRVTIVTPGFVESEMTKGKLLSKDGVVVVDPQSKDDVIRGMPIMSSGNCAEVIVEAVRRGERSVTVPQW